MKILLSKIKAYLNEPYPYYHGNAKRLLLILLLFSVLSFSFSYFFEPFDVNTAEHKIDSTWILLIHAAIPIPIAFIYLSILNTKVKDETTWTLGKEISHLSIVFLGIGIFGFLIRDFIYTNPNNWSMQYFLEEVRNTFLIGFLLLIVVIPLNLERLINKHSTSLKKLSPVISTDVNQTMLRLKIDGTSEPVALQLSTFLFAKVESNYTEIYSYTNKAVAKQLIRITLKELQERVKQHPAIVKRKCAGLSAFPKGL